MVSFGVFSRLAAVFLPASASALLIQADDTSAFFKDIKVILKHVIYKNRQRLHLPLIYQGSIEYIYIYYGDELAYDITRGYLRIAFVQSRVPHINHSQY